MPGSGSASSSGQPQPATSGVSYGPQAFENAGTPERILSLGQKSLSVAIIAHPDNNDRVFIGFDDNVDSNNGFILEPGVSVTIDLDVNQQNLWGVANQADDGVRFLVVG